MLLLSYRILYLNFDDACHKDYSRGIEQYLQVQVILIQGTRKPNYMGKLILLVICLKKI